MPLIFEDESKELTESINIALLSDATTRLDHYSSDCFACLYSRQLTGKQSIQTYGINHTVCSARGAHTLSATIGRFLWLYWNDTDSNTSSSFSSARISSWKGTCSGDNRCIQQIFQQSDATHSPLGSSAKMKLLRFFWNVTNFLFSRIDSNFSLFIAE